MLRKYEKYVSEGNACLQESNRGGMYSVTLLQQGGTVGVRLTSTHRVGLHSYVFNRDSISAIKGYLLIDLSHTLTRNAQTGTRCTGARAAWINDTMITGQASYAGGWGAQAPYTLYFAIQFNRPYVEAGIWEKDSLLLPVLQGSGNVLGAWSSYNTDEEKEVRVKVAISYTGIHQAVHNLSEINGWDMDACAKRNQSQWAEMLYRVQVQGATAEQRTMFYSALRNTLLMPTEVSDLSNGAKKRYWDFYAIWDTYRTVMPLHTLLYPQHQRDILNSLLQVYADSGWLPDAFIAGHFAMIQGGSNVDVVFADAIVKKLGGFNEKSAYEALLKNAFTESGSPLVKGRFLNEYLQYGYMTAFSWKSASSRTLEYAYNDYCIAQVANIQNDQSRYEELLKRSKNVFHLFYDSAGYFWAKDTLGNWMPDFTLQSKLPNSWDDPYFYEGGAEAYSYYVPHDMQGLINRHGGAKQFVKRLDAFFDEGRFHLHNEPLFLVPWAYHYAGMPWKSVQRVRRILSTQFRNTHDGLPGQDDSGAMSAWYAWSAMGLFPVAGQPVYLIGSPLFAETKIQLENGKSFIIQTNETAKNGMYIRDISLNGKPMKRAWITHEEIMNGGTLQITMSDIPVTLMDWALPPSLSAPNN
jgi:predicted alpha-1,2-mannosidase